MLPARCSVTDGILKIFLVLGGSSATLLFKNAVPSFGRFLCWTPGLCVIQTSAVESHSYCVFQSFYAGRPPNVSPDWIDTPYPNDDFAVVNSKGEKEMSGMRPLLMYFTVLKFYRAHVVVEILAAPAPRNGQCIWSQNTHLQHHPRTRSKNPRFPCPTSSPAPL